MVLARRSFLRLGGAAAGSATLGSAPAVAATPATGALDASVLGLGPNAAEDQSVTLAKAAQRAARESRPLFLPPGRYVASGVTLPPNLRLAGVAGTTRLVAADAKAPILILRGGEAGIAGLSFEGQTGAIGRDHALVLCEGVAALALRDCRFRASPGVGLRLKSTGGRVADNAFEGMAESAIFATDSIGLAIIDNTIARCGNNGIQVWRSTKGDDATRIAGNRIADIRADSGGSGQYGNAISLFRAGGCIVEGNTIRRVAYSAIRGNQASNLQMLGNNAAGCGEVALYVEFGFEGAIVANNLVERAANGISVTNYDHGGRLAVVQGNVLRRLRHGLLPQGETGGGVGIHVEAETAVTGNVIEEADTAGLSLGWGEALKDVAATSNLIRDASYGITVSVAPGAGKALVANNFIAGARRGAIAAMEWDRVAAEDLTRDGAARFPNVTLAGNRVG